MSTAHDFVLTPQESSSPPDLRQFQHFAQRCIQIANSRAEHPTLQTVLFEMEAAWIEEAAEYERKAGFR